MRTVGVVTVARSDYGIYLPVLRQLQREPTLRPMLIAAGMHLSPYFGLTVKAIEQDGFRVDERVEMLVASDTPEGVAKSLGLGIIGFAQVYARSRPDILLIMGDRYEMLAAASAALPFKVPVAHIHGGESTQGAIDEAIRHSITKMAHLHFASTEVYAQRLIQMGEEPWRVTVSGAPGLDNLRHFQPMSREALEREFGLDLSSPLLLVTYHPVTLEYEDTREQMAELLAALEDVGLPVVFTYPNADTGNHAIVQMLRDYVTGHEKARLVVNLGTQGYFSLMSEAIAMVGNSSSGIIEAPSFRLPAVNIGPRQAGRLRARNVIDVPCHRAAIAGGIRRAASPAFRASLADMDNPYGDGHAAERIVQRLATVPLDGKLLMKRFHDLQPAPVGVPV